MSKTSFNVEIDLTDLETDGKTLRELIVDQVAKRFYHDVKTTMAEVITTEVRNRIDGVIADKVKELVALPLPETDSYGQVRTDKKPLTIAERIMNRATAYLSERVDKNGRTPTYHSDEAMTRIQWECIEVVRKTMDVEFKAVIEEFKKTVGETVKQKMVAAVSKAMTEVIVKT